MVGHIQKQDLRRRGDEDPFQAAALARPSLVQQGIQGAHRIVPRRRSDTTTIERASARSRSAKAQSADGCRQPRKLRRRAAPAPTILADGLRRRQPRRQAGPEARRGAARSWRHGATGDGLPVDLESIAAPGLAFYLEDRTAPWRGRRGLIVAGRRRPICKGGSQDTIHRYSALSEELNEGKLTLAPASIGRKGGGTVMHDTIKRHRPLRRMPDLNLRQTGPGGGGAASRPAPGFHACPRDPGAWRP